MQSSATGASLSAPPPFAEMLGRVLPDLEIAVTPVFSKSSASLTLPDIARLAAMAHDAAESGEGVVVTHGTDVLEETAFALSLLTRSNVPIVFTGAMRLANQPSADGDANLIAAVRVAASATARGKGVLVVFDDEIHWAPLAKKRHAFRTHAFSSEPFGPLGWVREGEVRFTLAPARDLPRLTYGRGAPTVAILEAGPGLEPAVLEALSGCDGIVLSLPGGGHISDATPQILEVMAGKIPLVFASRTGAGETLTHSYGYAGGEMDLIRRGLVPAGPLDARRARIALSILLSNDTTRNDIAAFFASL